jgi:hypothetical protein
VKKVVQKVEYLARRSVANLEKWKVDYLEMLMVVKTVYNSESWSDFETVEEWVEMKGVVMVMQKVVLKV